MAQRTFPFLGFDPRYKPEQQVLVRNLGFFVNDITEIFGHIDDLSRAIAALPISPVGTFLIAANNLSDVLSANTSLNNLLPSQATHGGEFLTTDGTNASWAAIAAGGITSLNGLGAAVQTFSKVDDTNMTLTITSAIADHQFALAWAGTLADGRIASAATWNAKQDAISLTTIGTSGAATFIANTLNIPNYAVTPQSLTQNQIAFGSALNLVTSSANLTWIEASRDFTATGTISQVLSNTNNVWYVAQGNVGIFFTGAASTGLLAHQGFGIDMKTTEKYTMGAVGLANNNYFEINDTAGTAILTPLDGTGTQMVTADINGLLAKQAIPTIATLSPLTTKGDIFTFSTVNARLGIGSRDGQTLMVNAAATTGNAWSTSTFPSAIGTAGTILRSDGVDNLYTTATYPNTVTVNRLLWGSATNVISDLATANSGILITSAGGVPSIGTAIPNGVTATTQAAGTNNTTVATTAYADALTRSYVINGATIWVSGGSSGMSPADGATYFLRHGVSLTAITSSGDAKIYFPQAGTIIAARFTFTQAVGSAQTSTIYLRLNNTTDITVSSAVTNDASLTTFIGTGLSQAVNATTDYVEPKWVCPTWTPTNPTIVQVQWQILVKPN